LFISLVVVPLGLFTYVKMAWADGKVGLIRRDRARTLMPAGFGAGADHGCGALPRPL